VPRPGETVTEYGRAAAHAKEGITMKIEKLDQSLYSLRSAEEAEAKTRRTYSTDAVSFEGEKRSRKDPRQRQANQDEPESDVSHETFVLAHPETLGILDIVA
jgi:hypothetical protein